MDRKIGVSILFSLFVFMFLFGLTKVVIGELDTGSSTNIVLYGDGVSNNTFTKGGSSESVNLTIATVSTGSNANITNITINLQSGNFSFAHWLSVGDNAEYNYNTSGGPADLIDDVTSTYINNVTTWGDETTSGWSCVNLSLYILNCNGTADNVLSPDAAATANRTLIIRFNVTAVNNIEDKADWNITTQDADNFNVTSLTSYIDGLAPRLFDVNITDGNVTRNNGTSLNFTEFLDSESALTIRATVLDFNSIDGTMWLVYNGSDSGDLRGPAVIGHDNSLINRGVIVEGSRVDSGIEHHVSGEVYTIATTYTWTIPASATGSNISFQFLLNDTFNQAVTWNDSANGWGDGDGTLNNEPFQLITNESVIKMGQINLTINSKNILNSPTLASTYIIDGNVTLEFEVKGFTIEGDTVLQLVYNDTGAMDIETNGVIKNNAGALNLSITGDNITTREGFLTHDKSVVYTTSIDLTGNNSNNFNFAVVMVGTGVNESDMESNPSQYNYTAIAGPYQFTVDGTKPTVTITEPGDTTVSVSSSTGIEYVCKADDAGSGINKFTWTLTKPNSAQITEEVSASGTSTTKTFSGTNIDRAGIYTVDCQAEDNVGNQGSSSSKTFTAGFSTSSSTSGGSGGGSGTGATTTVSFDVDFSKATTGTIKAQQGLIKSFSFDGSTKHTITFDKVTATSATVTIASNPITITLDVGKTKEVDINLDGVNDVKVKLKSVVNGLADVEIVKIEAGAQVVAKEERVAAGIPEPEPTPIEQPTPQPVSRSNAGLWITLLVILAVIVIGYLSYRKK